MFRHLKALLSLVFNCAILIAKAQPGALDTTFNSGGSGASFHIHAAAVQSDGKIVIMGWFYEYNNYSVGNIARLMPDGQLDSTFHSLIIPDSTSNALVIQDDGKIIIAGNYDTASTTLFKYIDRLYPDGSHDTTFNVGEGFNDMVRSLTIQNDGKILVGGMFTSFNNIPTSHLCRLNTDGTIDTTFIMGNGPNSTVETILVKPDGKIMIAGDFTTYDGTYQIRIARLNTNGTLDQGFDAFPGANTAIYDMEMQSLDRLMVVGAFTTYDFQDKKRAIRLNTDGTIDAVFNPGLGADAQIQSVVSLPNDKSIFIGGFNSAFGLPAGKIASVRSNGHADSTFIFNTGSGANGDLYGVALQPNGKIITWGWLTSFNNHPVGRIARLYNCLTPAPSAIQGPDSILCSTSATYTVPIVPEADSYEWTLPIGWTGSSTTNSITVQTGGSGVISVRAFSDSCGWSNPSSKTIYQTTIPAPEICLVTVDSASTHNIILWEKNPSTTLIDSFFVYRETSTNNYTKIAAVPYDSLSEYHDYGANPNTTNYRYRLSALSTCGTETAPSPYHSTIHLQDQNNGNFNWNFYQIEGQANPVINYLFYKDTLLNGNFQQIGFISGNSNQFTDINFNALDSSDYVLDVEWAIGCDPTRTVNTTRSNIRHKNAPIGISDLDLQGFIINPNPTGGTFEISNLKFPTPYQILDITGRLTKQGKTKGPMDISEMENGIYVLKLGKSSYRIVKQ